MTVNCYQISDGPQLNRCEYGYAIEAIGQQKARIWIDLLDADTSDVENKLDDLRVQGLIRHFCLESIVQGQLPIIDTIISSDRPSKIPESSLDYLLWASANLKSADRKLEWLERRIEVMRSLIDMHAQERTNRRLARLTILSMIFMPVTFLAGIWGMNFNSMPLLSYSYGWIYALAVMMIISGGMYFYFRRKGWFD
jgi:Mg2+ and Co2+ transporter CorA